MFKRDMVLCIRPAGTPDTPIVIPVVNDTVDITTKTVTASETRTTLGSPQFTDLTINRGIQESTLKFTTYIKPYTDSGVITLPDELLHESLFGVSTGTATELTVETNNSYVLSKFDVFIIYRDTKTTFSLANAVTASAEFVFDLNGISRIKWAVVGVDFKQDDYLDYDYPASGSHIPNKYTLAHIDFPSSGYDLASTKFTLSVKNTIQFPYTEIVNTAFNRPTDTPIIQKREILAKFSVYLKVVTLDLYNDLINSLETYSYLGGTATNFNASIGPCGGTKYIDIVLDDIVVKYPKIKMNEATNLDLEFKGTSANIIYKE